MHIARAREALRLAEDDPARAVALAAAVAREALDGGDFAAAALAERALGLAALHLEDLDTSLRHLRTATALGGRAGAPQLAAGARMTLAFALNSRGRPHQALREIDLALRDLPGVERAQAQVQRGAILQLLGRFDEALACYQIALPALRRAGDLLWEWRVLCNRGVVHTYRYAFTAAERDLLEAEQVGKKLNLELSDAFIQQNLGFLNVVRGDVPAALQFLDAAERRFHALRTHLGSVLSDRSELLLSVCLVSEARETARAAVREFERERRGIALPEARLLLARAAALDGDPAGAFDAARRAAREFAQQRRPEWAALARFTMLICRHAGQPPPSPVTVGQAERAAEALTAARWPAAALEARLLAATLALGQGRIGRGSRQLELARRGRRRGPALLRMRAWHAQALLRMAEGNRRGAATAIDAGLRVFDEHRATLGATDLRAHAAGHRTDLVELGLRIALQDGRPDRVLRRVEQGHASHLLLRPVRPPDDPVLARVLAELRLTTSEIDRQRSDGGGAVRLVQRQVALEREIRDHCRRQSGEARSRPDGPVPLDALAAALDDAALVEYFQLDGVLHALTVVAGTMRLHALGPVVRVGDLIGRVPFALRRLADPRTSAASRAAAVTLLRHTAERFDTILLRPLAGEIGDRPLVLVPTGPLQSLPWAILPSCAGRPATVSPSATLWHTACRRRQLRMGGVTVAAGPDLPYALAEAEAVAAIHRTVPLLGPAATVEAVTTALGGVDLAHLAAHGRLRADNPLFSSLRFADGPLTVYDLERLEQTPSTVVLAACGSGQAVVCAGDELLGMGVTFLSHGARQLVASVYTIPDAETAPLMVEFHRRVAAGDPPAAALAGAQQRMVREEPAVLAAAAGFVCIGEGLRGGS